MKKVLMSTIAAVAMFVSSSAVIAQPEFFRYDVTNSPWMVYGVLGDKANRQNPACYGEIMWRDGSRLQLIRDLEDGELYIVFTNNEWNIGDATGSDKVYTARVNFRSSRGDVSGMNFDYHLISKNKIVIRGIVKEKFVNLFMDNSKMVFVMPGNIQNAEVDLTGSSRVMQQIAQCIMNSNSISIWPDGKPTSNSGRRELNI